MYELCAPVVHANTAIKINFPTFCVCYLSSFISMSEAVETTAETPVVPFKSHLDEELYKARGELREIDENLRNLTGRNVMELTSR